MKKKKSPPQMYWIYLKQKHDTFIMLIYAEFRYSQRQYGTKLFPGLKKIHLKGLR